MTAGAPALNRSRTDVKTFEGAVGPKTGKKYVDPVAPGTRITDTAKFKAAGKT